MEQLPSILNAYQPITLKEMDGVKLMDRVDTKYALNEQLLGPMLEAIQGDYRCLEVKGGRGTSYRSLYFDTPEKSMFVDHHNGRPRRNKVRMREYVGSDLCFLEVKRKTGRGRTDKVRIKIPKIDVVLTPEQKLFVDRSIGEELPLVPSMENSFTRITLVHRSVAERLTIDHSVRFAVPGGDEAMLAGIVVAEVKQEKYDKNSPFIQFMRTHGIRASSMSKYCIGSLSLFEGLKYNRFKSTLLHLDKIRNAA